MFDGKFKLDRQVNQHGVLADAPIMPHYLTPDHHNLPSIGFSIGRIDHKCTSILSTSRGEEGQANVRHISKGILVEDNTVDLTLGG